MKLRISADQLISLGLDNRAAHQFVQKMNILVENNSTPEEAWHVLTKELLGSNISFAIHLFIFYAIFPHWHQTPDKCPAWIPTDELETANIVAVMNELSISDIKTFHKWSVAEYASFWALMIQKLHIQFKKPPIKICDTSKSIESPTWLPESSLNIADSCFNAAPEATAIIFTDENKNNVRISYQSLNNLSNRIANSLVQQGFQKNDPIAIAMPMNEMAVAIYIGIIKMGGVVVSIADSFSSEEMAMRLKLVAAKAIFTQDVTYWAGKKLELYEKIKKINLINTSPIKIIVIPYKQSAPSSLANEDVSWNDFLSNDTNFTSLPCAPSDGTNLLFSSGTTGTPKVIIWDHTTAIKVASDAFYHQNIKAGDVLAWPTNLGWMMGPWLIYAALINHATLALYVEAPKDRAFGEFIEQAKVTMLGVVPTLVSTWRQTQCMEKLDWRSIKLFSSSGECSNPEDMLYLMSLANYKPIIEYCGGTEIGGAYISSTVIQNNYPSLFTTPAMGSDFTILNEDGKPASIGEVALIPPAIGLSNQLLNGDHYALYYKNMPKTADGIILRRHGDQIKSLPNGLYAVLGRVDDTMNLGGIKISAAEIEQVLKDLPEIKELAAIGILPALHGPTQLVVYVVTDHKLEKENMQKIMQKKINTLLNPLFKIHDLVFVSELPKTASNKIMRRVLRQQYQDRN